MTLDGLELEKNVERGHSITAETGRTFDRLIIAVLVLAVAYFADLSAEGRQAYSSDGIAEEVLNDLVRVDDLSVASRTSSGASASGTSRVQTGIW